MAATPGARTRELDAFLAARDRLLEHREDYDTIRREFRWPQLTYFNWARDYFDEYARGNQKTALWVVEDGGAETKLTFDDHYRRSNQVANFLKQQGVRKGDRIILMLPNVVAIWEMMLAALKLGGVLIPTSHLLVKEDLCDRMERGKVTHVVTNAAGAEKFAEVAGAYSRIVVGDAVTGWTRYENAYGLPLTFSGETTKVDDPFLLYFTSGTTAKPKL